MQCLQVGGLPPFRMLSVMAAGSAGFKIQLALHCNREV